MCIAITCQLLVLLIISSRVFSADNLCSRTENYTVTSMETYTEPVVVNTFTWCLKIPPRCPKTRTETRQRYRVKTESKTRRVIECCEGYKTITASDGTTAIRCLPLCDKCLSGICVSPNRCHCNPGYHGDNCAIECPRGTWGLLCKEKCNCIEDVPCNPVNGHCACPPGLRGRTCNESCPNDRYGPACAFSCECKNSASGCHPVTGRCIEDDASTVNADYTDNLDESPNSSVADNQRESWEISRTTKTRTEDADGYQTLATTDNPGKTTSPEVSGNLSSSGRMKIRTREEGNSSTTRPVIVLVSVPERRRNIEKDRGTNNPFVARVRDNVDSHDVVPPKTDYVKNVHKAGDVQAAPIPLDIALIVIASIVSLGLTSVAVVMVLHMRSKLLEAARMSIYDEAKTKNQENPSSTRISSIAMTALPQTPNASPLCASASEPGTIFPVHAIDPSSNYANGTATIGFRASTDLRDFLQDCCHYDRPPSTRIRLQNDFETNTEHVYDEIPLQSSPLYARKNAVNVIEDDMIARLPKIRIQLFVRARSFNMTGSLIVFCLVLTLFAVDTLAIEGVKGGHRPHRPNQPTGFNSTVQAGLCYKRIPYADALALNSSGQFPRNTLPSTSEDEPTNGWITILDCCDGYERNFTSGGCEPRCIQGCLGGRCTAPNVCSCAPGWFPQEGVCMPYCERPCQRDAYCFSPNVCACKLGYDEVDGECKPICPGGCRNGDCVAPRVCRCTMGYVLRASPESTGIEPKECVPVCENGCRNGQCTAPGICTCNEGYGNPPNDRESCVPKCPAGCIDGECVAPGVCKCKPGFSLGSNNKCNPECPKGCANGECVFPGVCRCKPGYTTDSGNNCVPECRQGCINGQCIGPGICNCNPGYALDASNRCSPDCPEGCENGECVGPGVCNCKLGFSRDSNGKCAPLASLSSTASQCRFGCGTNGTCVGPNRCVCDMGFRVDPDTGKCIPAPMSFQCRNGCGPHGVCVGPDYCICDYGMSPDPITGRCPELPSQPQPSAHCEFDCGPNSKCVGTNRCACNPGYVAEPATGTCVPRFTSQIGESVCEMPCINGECVAPNRCSCKRGYAMDPNDVTRSRCLPVCIGGCANGVCTAPNLCICNLGYRKETGVKGRQRCVPI
nr:PREDICTED: multiple epidermal growth factor-like domains protein 10 [Megachile rotundata]